MNFETIVPFGEEGFIYDFFFDSNKRPQFTDLLVYRVVKPRRRNV